MDAVAASEVTPPRITVAVWGFDAESVESIARLEQVELTLVEGSPESLASALTIQRFDVIAVASAQTGELARVTELVRAHPPECAVLLVGEEAAEVFPDAAALDYDVWMEPDPACAVDMFRPLLRSVAEREALSAVRAYREISFALDAVLVADADLGEAVAAAMEILATHLDCRAASFWRPSALGRSLIRVGCTGPDAELDRATAGDDRRPAPGCDRLLELLVEGTPAGRVLRTGVPLIPDGGEHALLLPAKSNGRVCGVVALTGATSVARRRTSFELATTAIDRVAALVQWHIADQQFKALTLGSSAGIVLLDSAGTVVSINAAALALLGASLADALDAPISSLLAPRWWERHHADLNRRAERARHDAGESIELLLEPVGSAAREVDLSLSAWGSGVDRRIAVTVRDISKRKRAERRVAELAYTDSDTRLGNEEALRGYLGMFDRPGLILMEIQRFRRLAETLGRDGGAATLRAASERLSGALPDGAQLFRLDGERFAAIVPDADEDALMAGVRALRASLAEPVEVSGTHLYLFARFAATRAPADGDPAAAVDCGVRALAHAQRQGLDASELFDAEDPPDAELLHREADLHEAVATGQLELHYQPIVDLADGRTIAAEALLRWRHPVHGLIPPAGFLDIAEQSGLIREIGIWVAHEACRQLAEWQREHPSLVVSFNVSPRQLIDTELLDAVEDAIVASGVDARKVTAEIVESSALHDLITAREALAGLKRLGLSIALDDFGVGESSLGRLNDLNVDILKVDRSLTSGLPDDRVSSALTRSAIELARGLGLTTVVEGIETPRQASYLAEHGAQLGQGYHFARPMPAAEFEAFLNAGASASLARAGGAGSGRG